MRKVKSVVLLSLLLSLSFFPQKKGVAIGFTDLGEKEWQITDFAYLTDRGGAALPSHGG